MPKRQEFDRRYILNLSCPDQMGIVAEVASFLAQQGCNILESAQFDDEISGQFFMRTVFGAGETTPSVENIESSFNPIAQRFSMNWKLYNQGHKPRVLIMVSKPGHCLNDLLYRVSIGALEVDVVGIISNHLDQEQRAVFYDIPYHYLPITPETKTQQENEVLKIIEDTNTELTVLARYMQILTPETCEILKGRVINIHHSFLPGFKGSKPYDQAYIRGVKLIGATAHYVTPNLDEGPIIDQETTRVTHAQHPQELERVGRDLESLVLARAVRYHIQHRVITHEDRTDVFY